VEAEEFDFDPAPVLAELQSERQRQEQDSPKAEPGTEQKPINTAYRDLPENCSECDRSRKFKTALIGAAVVAGGLTLISYFFNKD